MHIQKQTSKQEMTSLPEHDPAQGKDCSHGGTFILTEEIPIIAKLVSKNTENFTTTYLLPIELFHTAQYRTKTKKGRNSPCIFYDEHGHQCTIKEAKPIYCRITNTDHAEAAHQWYLVNYVVNPHDPSSIREWKAYADTILVIPGGKPEDLVGLDILKKILSFEELRLQPPSPPPQRTREEKSTNHKKQRTTNQSSRTPQKKKIVRPKKPTSLATRRKHHGKNHRH
jgi:Fe-S-cluster containining protein